MPREFITAVEYAINSLLRRACCAEELDGERVQNLLTEAQASNVMLDKTTLEFLDSGKKSRPWPYALPAILRNLKGLRN